jgi:hypothetical protein
MKRVAGCLVVLFAIAAAWLGCRVDFDLVDQEIGIGTGTGTDMVDAPVDIAGEGSGSVDAAVDAPVDGSGSGSDIDAAVDAPVDSPGSGSVDAAVDAAIDAPDNGSGMVDAAIDAAIDAPIGSSEAPGDATGAPDARRNDGNALDRTSFYACAGGGCGSTTGAEVWLPLVVALGFGFRRPRARRRAR